MRIALCDDEKKETDRIRSLIETYALEQDLDIRCAAFQDGNALLREEKYDLYLLDFMMDGMNGIELAKALRARFDDAVTVCFLTNYESAATEIINEQIYADGFLKKPVEPELLYEKLRRFYRASQTRRIELKRGAEYRTVYPREILYAEADGKRTLLHFRDRTEDYHYLLSEIAEMLGSSVFYRIHRSFLINFEAVTYYDAKSVTLKNGETLPLKDKNFIPAYRRYIFSSKL